MKKFIIEIIFYFFIPITVIAVVSEYSVRSIPNNYAYKSKWLENNSQNIESIYLGSSSIFYDINPSLSKRKGFNAAHVSQPIKYDHFIFNKYWDQMDSIKYVVIGIDYWSPYSRIEGSPEWWRIKYYTIHYDSPYHEGKSKYKYELYLHNSHTFKNAIKGFIRLIGLGNISHITVNELGYGNDYTTQYKTIDWDNGVTEGTRHNSIISESKQNTNIYKENKEYIIDICKKCMDRGVKVILIGTPVYKSYLDTLDKDFVNKRDQFCNEIAKSFDNTVFLNFAESNHFTEEDFYDANHLNEIGTKKFTLMIDQAMDNM